MDKGLPQSAPTQTASPQIAYPRTEETRASVLCALTLSGSHLLLKDEFDLAPELC